MRIVTILSDFGLQDATLASVKGTLLQEVKDVTIIDISHTTTPFQMQQAAYLLEKAWRHFPKNTVHLILFNVFYDKKPRLILCEEEGQFFLTPDNSILPLALKRPLSQVWSCYELTPPDHLYDWVAACGQAAEAIFAGAYTQIYPSYNTPFTLRSLQPSISNNYIECQVLYIDQFGNVVLNLTRSDFEETRKGRNFSIHFMREEVVSHISDYYFNEPRGKVLCRFNKSDYLEIAISQDNAAQLLGIQPNNQEQVFYNTIKIYFE